jgi:hypothetical protein
MMYMIFQYIVAFVGVAMTVREGLWSNAITLVNITVSGLVAFGFYMPIVIYLDEATDGRHTYWLDFAVIWTVFAATMVVCRAATRAASKTRLRFKNPIDPYAGPFVGGLAAAVLTAFTLATLHTAPMPSDAFGGGLLHDDVATASAAASPDLVWLRFVEKVCQPTALGSESTTRFGAKGFVEIYKKRRTAFEKASTLVVDRG